MVIITSSAIYVAVRITFTCWCQKSVDRATSQVSKEASKGKQTILPSSSEDISLEESLLNHQEDEEDRDT